MITIKHIFTDVTLCEFDVETIKEAVFKAVEEKKDLRCAYLRGAYLQGADLKGADLQGADLQGADLKGADLRGADLKGAYLQGAYLQGAYLKGAYLQGAYLKGAYLKGADLKGAYLQGAYLQDAYLKGAYLRCAEIDGEKITKAPLSIDGLRYWCLISDGFMRLGCKRFTHAEWVEFNDEQISDMDSDALEFWKKFKTPLLEMCKAHAAKD